MDDVVELEADLKVMTILARRLVPQWHLRVLTHVRCMTTTLGPSDSTEVAEVDLLAEFRQHDDVQRGRYTSCAWPLLGAMGYERGGEVVGGVVGFIGFSSIFGLIKITTWLLYI